MTFTCTARALYPGCFALSLSIEGLGSSILTASPPADSDAKKIREEPSKAKGQEKEKPESPKGPETKNRDGMP
jgi:hypothetical protein